MIQSIVESFLGDKRVLLLAPSGSVRANYLKLLSSLGARRDNIQVVSDAGMALEALEQKAFSLVWVDLEIQNERDRKLFFHLLEEPNPELGVCLIHLDEAYKVRVSEDCFAGNAFQFLSKKASLSEIQDGLVRGVLDLVKADDESRLSRAAEKLYREKAWAKLKKLIELLNLGDRTHADWQYLTGKVMEIYGHGEVARDHYLRGLRYNKNSYRCIRALYSQALRGKHYKDAFSFGLKLREIAFLDSTRLGELFVLNVFSGNHNLSLDLLNDYFELEGRSLELKQLAQNSLLSSAKMIARRDGLGEAKVYFEKAIRVAEKDWSVIKKAVEFLIDTNEVIFAEEILLKTREEDKESHEYVVLDFKLGAKVIGENFVLTKSREIIKQGQGVHPVIFEELIRVQVKRKNRMGFEQALMEAKKMLPDYSEQWDALEKDSELALSA